MYSQEIQEKNKDLQSQLQKIKKMAIGTYISIITLNDLNAPTKRHRLTEWIQKQDPCICCLQETHFRPKDTYRLKVRGWKYIFHKNGRQKKAGVAILISDKTDLKIKITKDKEGHYIKIKGSIQKEDISSVQFSCSVVSDSLRTHESQHSRPPCPSQTPIVCSNSCPLSQ